MARGILVVVVLITGVVALAAQSWNKTLQRLDERMLQFQSATVDLRSRVVFADDEWNAPIATVVRPVRPSLFVPNL